MIGIGGRELGEVYSEEHAKLAAVAFQDRKMADTASSHYSVWLGDLNGHISHF